MKYLRTTFKSALLISASVLLASCGGGGDNAGDVETFTTSPKDFGVKAGSCAGTAGLVTTVVIIGGKAPFRVINSWPDTLSVDKTEVTGKDPQFKITTLGGCADPAIITVLDYHSRTTVIEATLEVEEAPTTP